jgi:5-methylcytosine-specific restriction endonuclease McrA
VSKPGPKSQFLQLQDREWLAQQVAAGRLGGEIADEIGCSRPLLYQTVKKLGISWEPRTALRLRDKEWLYEQYVTRMRGTTAIAAEVGVTDTTVAAALRRHGIPARTQKEGRGVRSSRLRAMVQMPEAADMYRDGNTIDEVALRFGVSEHVAKGALIAAGVTIRSKSENLKMRRAHPEHGRRYREASERRRRPTGVRAMKKLLAQDALCAFCGADEDLEQHHLNAVRSDDRPENIVPLCRDCHAKVEWLVHRATEGLRRAYRGEHPELRLPA